MYNLCYHIVTVTAIFVALAVGLLLGAAIGRSNTVQTTTDSLVESLRDSLDALQGERDELEGQARSAERLSDALVGAWIDGRLAGHRALVLSNAGSDDAAARAKNVLAAAGAEVMGVTLTLPQEGDAAYEELRSELVSSGLLGEGVPQARADLASELGGALAAEWRAAAGAADAAAVSSGGSSFSDGGSASSADAPTDSRSLGAAFASASGDAAAKAVSSSLALTGLLRSLGVLESAASDADLASCTLVADVACEGVSTAPLSLALAGSLAQAGVPAVTAQLAGIDSTLVKDAWRRGVSGMAGLDEPAGAYGVVALLSGALPGAYGIDGHDPWPSLPDDAARGSSAGDASATSDAALPRAA